MFWWLCRKKTYCFKYLILFLYHNQIILTHHLLYFYIYNVCTCITVWHISLCNWVFYYVICLNVVVYKSIEWNMTIAFFYVCVYLVANYLYIIYIHVFYIFDFMFIESPIFASDFKTQRRRVFFTIVIFMLIICCNVI